MGVIISTFHNHHNVIIATCFKIKNPFYSYCCILWLMDKTEIRTLSTNKNIRNSSTKQEECWDFILLSPSSALQLLSSSFNQKAHEPRGYTWAFLGGLLDTLKYVTKSVSYVKALSVTFSPFPSYKATVHRTTENTHDENISITFQRFSQRFESHLSLPSLFKWSLRLRELLKCFSHMLSTWRTSTVDSASWLYYRFSHSNDYPHHQQKAQGSHTTSFWNTAAYCRPL